MLKSMTGYGCGKVTTPFGRFVVEVQTVNRKHLEATINLPREFIQMENDLRKEVSDKITRGKISVYVGFDRIGPKSRAVRIDMDLANKYYEAYNKIKEKFKIKSEIELSELVAAKDVIKYEEAQVDAAAVAKDVRKALTTALLNLNKMRVTEGRAIDVDVKKRLKMIQQDIVVVEKIMPRTVKDFEVKLRARVKDFEKEGGSDERVSREVAIFADRIDVSEEILRLTSHIKQFSDVLKKGEPVGKIVDFIIQEMMREANTIGSKANNAEIARRIINIKSELEKIREQIQNVE